jgi:hypothetical protein
MLKTLVPGRGVRLRTIMARTRGSRCAMVVACLSAFPLAGSGAEMPDSERGRALYENHCLTCHGRSVHARTGKAPLSRRELVQVVEQWQRAEHLQWSAEDTRDVVAYLESEVYRRP